MREEKLKAYLKGACAGRRYRVSGAELEQVLGINGTDLRKLVNRLRRKGIPVGSDRSGYFYAVTAGEVYDTIFPPDLNQYGEPFSGSAAVLLALLPDPNRLDIYNDLDADLSNFYSCVKECTNVLMRELRFLPIQSRATFEYYRDFLMHKDVYYQNIAEEIKCLGDRSCFTEEQEKELMPIFEERLKLFDVKRAAAYCLAIHGSFSGTIKSYGVKGVDVERFLKRFPAVSKRLKDVPIENKNALQFIKERDRVGGLLYCDPPYVNTEKMYRASSRIRNTRRFHIRLWQVVSGCKGYVVLSYNDCPFIRKLYQDWYILSFQRSNPLSQKKGSSFGELLITNYDPRPYI